MPSASEPIRVSARATSSDAAPNSSAFPRSAAAPRLVIGPFACTRRRREPRGPGRGRGRRVGVSQLGGRRGLHLRRLGARQSRPQRDALVVEALERSRVNARSRGGRTAAVERVEHDAGRKPSQHGDDHGRRHRRRRNRPLPISAGARCPGSWSVPDRRRAGRSTPSAVAASASRPLADAGRSAGSFASPRAITSSTRSKLEPPLARRGGARQVPEAGGEFLVGRPGQRVSERRARTRCLPARAPRHEAPRACSSGPRDPQPTRR